MRCRLCYTTCTPEDRFCPHCGSPVNQPGALIEDPPPFPKALPAPKKRPNFRKIFQCCGAALLAVALIWAVVCLATRPPRFGESANTLALSADNIPYMLSEEGQPVPLTDDSILMILRSSNGRGILWLTQDETMGFAYDGQVVGTASAYMGTISFDGSAAVYCTQEGEVHWMDMTSGQDVLVAQDVIQSSFLSISPEGDYIAYQDQEGNAWRSRRGGTPELLAEGMVPVALSRDGEIAYLMDRQNDALYSLKKGMLTFLTDDFINICANRDVTELLFANQSGIFFSQNGEAFRKVATGSYDSATTLLPEQSGFFSMMFLTCDVSTLVGLPLSCRTFEAYGYGGGQAFYFLLEEEGAVELSEVDYYSMAHLTADGKTLFYTHQNTLYSCDLEGDYTPTAVVSLSEKPEGGLLWAWFDEEETPRFFQYDQELYAIRDGSCEKLAEGVHSILKTPDGQGIYVLQGGDADGYTLMLYDWEGTATQMAAELELSASMSLLEDGLFLTDANGKSWYLDGEGTLIPEGTAERTQPLSGGEQEGM